MIEKTKLLTKLYKLINYYVYLLSLIMSYMFY